MARGHTCEYGPEIKKAKVSDTEDSDSSEDGDDDDSDHQADRDGPSSHWLSSEASPLPARRPAVTVTVRKRRNTEYVSAYYDEFCLT